MRKIFWLDMSAVLLAIVGMCVCAFNGVIVGIGLVFFILYLYLRITSEQRLNEEY